MATLRANLHALIRAFHSNPSLALKTFVVRPAMGLLVCSWRGHRQDNVSRILGICDHCLHGFTKGAPRG